MERGERSHDGRKAISEPQASHEAGDAASGASPEALQAGGDAAVKRMAEAGPRSVTVQAGDTLSEIAAREMGDASMWHALWEANKAKVPNPNLIHPGQVLTVPEGGSPAPQKAPEQAPPQKPQQVAPPPVAVPGKKPAEQPAAPTEDSHLYTVRSGDTLSQIAKAQLGDPGRWREIWELNRDKIPDPNVIFAGAVLRLPGGAPKQTEPPAPSKEGPAPQDGGGGGSIDPKKLSWTEQVAYNIYKAHDQFLQEQANNLGIDVEVAAAVLMCESSGSGFVGDRLTIRFEPGIFKGYTGEVVADTHAGQDAEYAALQRAIDINRDKAYESISMGAAQIMGFNAQSIGFENAEQMFDAFKGSETRQLMGLFEFVAGRPALLKAARVHDWATFALYYNGPGYKANDYDTKMANYSEAYAQILKMVGQKA